MREQPRNVEPLVVVDPALHGADGDDLGARFAIEQPSQVAAHISESLNDDACPFQRDAEVARVFLHHVHDAPAGRFLAPQRATQGHRFPGHNRGAVALAARVFIENPGHHLRIGVHIGSGNIPVGAEHDRDPLREPASQALELELRELLGIDRDATLRAAEGDIHQRRLPRHDRREPEHFVVIRLGVVANPPFARTAGAIVLYAIAGEHLDPPVIHPHRDLDLHLAKWRHEDFSHVRFEVDQVGGAIELTLDDRAARHRRTTGSRGRISCSHVWTGSSTLQGVKNLIASSVIEDAAGDPPAGRRGVGPRSRPARGSARGSGASHHP